MEKGLIVQNLSEAKDQVEEIIKKIENQHGYDFFDFQLDVKHVVMHVNTAYNIGTWSAEKVEKDYTKKFDELIRIPDDKYLIDHS